MLLLFGEHENVICNIDRVTKRIKFVAQSSEFSETRSFIAAIREINKKGMKFENLVIERLFENAYQHYILKFRLDEEMEPLEKEYRMARDKYNENMKRMMKDDIVYKDHYEVLVEFNCALNRLKGVKDQVINFWEFPERLQKLTDVNSVNIKELALKLMNVDLKRIDSMQQSALDNFFSLDGLMKDFSFDLMGNFPGDIRDCIFYHLEDDCISKLVVVSRRWHHMVNNSNFWMYRCYKFGIGYLHKPIEQFPWQLKEKKIVLESIQLETCIVLIKKFGMNGFVKQFAEKMVEYDELKKMISSGQTKSLKFVESLEILNWTLISLEKMFPTDDRNCVIQINNKFYLHKFIIEVLNTSVYNLPLHYQILKFLKHGKKKGIQIQKSEQLFSHKNKQKDVNVIKNVDGDSGILRIIEFVKQLSCLKFSRDSLKQYLFKQKYKSFLEDKIDDCRREILNVIGNSLFIALYLNKFNENEIKEYLFNNRIQWDSMDCLNKQSGITGCRIDWNAFDNCSWKSIIILEHLGNERNKVVSESKDPIFTKMYHKMRGADEIETESIQFPDSIETETGRLEFLRFNKIHKENERKIKEKNKISDEIVSLRNKLQKQFNFLANVAFEFRNEIDLVDFVIKVNETEISVIEKIVFEYLMNHSLLVNEKIMLQQLISNEFVHNVRNGLRNSLLVEFNKGEINRHSVLKKMINNSNQMNILTLIETFDSKIIQLIIPFLNLMSDSNILQFLQVELEGKFSFDLNLNKTNPSTEINFITEKRNINKALKLPGRIIFLCESPTLESATLENTITCHLLNFTNFIPILIESRLNALLDLTLSEPDLFVPGILIHLLFYDFHHIKQFNPLNLNLLILKAQCLMIIVFFSICTSREYSHFHLTIRIGSHFINRLNPLKAENGSRTFF
ncbi:hypothetical protein O9G_004579 [Rozella allomycis CSF55]|uniref:F-box domain-containing protein n=1 Tax=Rozella allomycis (strain CSF55) TaxID=988480 RepID=A0A075B2D7_ROZAC|nr:hypothetical protein O9G_004579 [Rozella allomycis CSF55]|eukprot:EPZ34983.1 hypothetical protein O9G_004579 [Rozella allomycis CSF55]